MKIFSETDDVTGVFIGRDFITLTKVSDASFEHVKPVAFGAIMNFFAEGTPVMLNEAPVSDTTVLDSDSEVVAMIKVCVYTLFQHTHTHLLSALILSLLSGAP